MNDLCGTCGAYWDCDCLQEEEEVLTILGGEVRIKPFRIPDLEYRPWDTVEDMHEVQHPGLEEGLRKRLEHTTEPARGTLTLKMIEDALQTYRTTQPNRVPDDNDNPPS